MKIVGPAGEPIDWHRPDDSGLEEMLNQWRRYTEMKLAMPDGCIRGVEWDDDGEVRLVLDRNMLPLL